MPEFTFSFIIPTRGRPEALTRLCDSIRAHTRHPDQLEIVFVMDSDDQLSLQFKYDGLNIRKVEVAPGMSMGELNTAGYRVTRGRYLMLLNDDVVLRTPAWDDRVLEIFRAYPDDMVLVHVNENLFREKLCTFPFLARAFCDLAGGICPSGYLRYRIDDHIHNVFDLLMLLGRRRRIFLSDVIFEHHNFVATDQGHEYVPNPDVHAVDTRLFNALLPERKRLALAALETIEGYLRSEKRRVGEGRLSPVTDSVAIRDPGRARFHPLLEGQWPRVTVAVVSANLRSDHAKKCIELVKAHSQNYDLVIVDNNRSAEFNHSREMNRLLEFCSTEYLVLMDDDVFVQPGWLEGLLRAMAPEVGVVTPVHYDSNGNFSYAGVIMQPDDSGHHTHVMSIGDRPQNIQSLCSAVMLIDMNRCGHIRLDEMHSKYFLDIDYGLRIWEQGFRVVCSPWARVTHVGGGTMEQGGGRSVQLFEEQRRHFCRQWVETRRIHALRRGIWKAVPEFVEFYRLQREIDGLFFEGSRLSRGAFLSRARSVADNLDALPALKNYLAQKARLALGERFPRADDTETGYLAILLGILAQAVLYEAGVDGMNLVLWKNRFFALPGDEGGFEPERMSRGGYSRSYESGDPQRIKEMIAKGGSHGVHLSDGPSLLPPGANDASAVAVIDFQPEPTTPRQRNLWATVDRLVRALPYAGVLRPHGDRGLENLFDVAYYRTTYPDVAASGVNPLFHFITTGAFEGRNPHALFDTTFYLEKYPDVAATRVNPLGHYLRHGAAEGRQPHPLFDPLFYLERYPDVRRADINPLVHYCLYGAVEGRQPHPWFQPEYYVSQCSESTGCGENPLVHLLRSGPRSHRPHPLFDCQYYLRENADVASLGINPLVHYVLVGLTEGRRPSAEFNICERSPIEV
jgi:GT2 family glycosyltransferase